jgi:subtilisin family serine protease
MRPPPHPRRALRFAVAAAAAAGLAVAVLSASCNGPEYADCAIPTLGEKAADGGPDPCHCNPPPSLNILACPCLQGDNDVYNACIVLYWAELDAGLD